MRNSVDNIVSDKLQSFFTFKRKAMIAGILFLIIALFVMTDHKNSTELIVRQGWFGGVSCVEGEGYFWKGPATTYHYDRTKSFYFNSSTEKVKGEGWEGDETDEDDIHIPLSRNAEAWMTAYLMYELPTVCEDLIRLHNYQHTQEHVKHNLVRNAALAAIKKTGPLFTAEEAKITKAAEFRLVAYDQLVDGEFLTETEKIQTVIEDDIGEEDNVSKKPKTQEFTITKLKLDTNGNRILTKVSPLKEYGIVLKQFDILDVRLDTTSEKQLLAVKKREMERVLNQTKTETEKQRAITEKAKGEADKMQAKYEKEVEKEKAVTEARKDSAVAALHKKTAELKADSITLIGEAQAKVNRALVKSELTPQEKAEWHYKETIGIAQAIASSNQKWVSDVTIYGESSKNGGMGMTPIDAGFGITMILNAIKATNEYNASKK